MKPEFVSFDGGYHNANLEASSKRILEGGSWKKQRVVVILPAAAQIPVTVAMSHWSLIFPPNQGVFRMAAQGMEVGDAYSTAIEQVLANPDLSQWEFILTLESDNVPPADGLIKLLARMEAHPEFSCIGGLYWCKGPGGCPHIWGDPKDTQVNYRPQPPVTGQLVECVGTSMGFNLWRMSMFKDQRIKRPLFRTLNGANGQGVGTQDLAFWTEARKYGYRCAVDCDVRVGHYDFSGAFGPAGTMW